MAKLFDRRGPWHSGSHRRRAWPNALRTTAQITGIAAIGRGVNISQDAHISQTSHLDGSQETNAAWFPTPTSPPLVSAPELAGIPFVIAPLRKTGHCVNHMPEGRDVQTRGPLEPLAGPCSRGGGDRGRTEAEGPCDGERAVVPSQGTCSPRGADERNNPLAADHQMTGVECRVSFGFLKWIRRLWLNVMLGRGGRQASENLDDGRLRWTGAEMYKGGIIGLLVVLDSSSSPAGKPSSQAPYSRVTTTPTASQSQTAIMKFSITVTMALAGLSLAAPVPQQS